MKLIDFFATYIKPLRLRGTGMLNPTDTQKITERLYAVRQHDVNYWLYRTGDDFIAIDSGYINYPDPKEALYDLGIDPNKVKWVFLTHADCDHAGGIAEGGPVLFENAMVYLHKKEEPMILGQEKRFRFGPIKIANPLKRRYGYKLLEDNEKVQAGDVVVEILHIPGHTKGHSVYLIDNKVLFTGDSLALNQDGGWCFFEFFNMDTSKNIQSLSKLKDFVEKRKPSYVCTGHSGYTQSIGNLFNHMNTPGQGTRSHPFDNRAPYDVFSKK